MAHIKNNLGIISEKQVMLKEAYEYYQEAYKIKKEYNDKISNLDVTLNNLGSIELKFGNLTKAINYLE